MWDLFSVTRLGDLLHFGYFSKPVATIIFTKSHPLNAIFLKLLKSFILLGKLFLGNFYRHLAIFYRSHWIRLIYKLDIFCSPSSWSSSKPSSHSLYPCVFGNFFTYIFAFPSSGRSVTRFGNISLLLQKFYKSLANF